MAWNSNTVVMHYICSHDSRMLLCMRLKWILRTQTTCSFSSSHCTQDWMGNTNVFSSLPLTDFCQAICNNVLRTPECSAYALHPQSWIIITKWHVNMRCMLWDDNWADCGQICGPIAANYWQSTLYKLQSNKMGQCQHIPWHSHTYLAKCQNRPFVE